MTGKMRKVEWLYKCREHAKSQVLLAMYDNALWRTNEAMQQLKDFVDLIKDLTEQSGSQLQQEAERVKEQANALLAGQQAIVDSIHADSVGYKKMIEDSVAFSNFAMEDTIQTFKTTETLHELHLKYVQAVRDLMVYCFGELVDDLERVELNFEDLMNFALTLLGYIPTPGTSLPLSTVPGWLKQAYDSFTKRSKRVSATDEHMQEVEEYIKNLTIFNEALTHVRGMISSAPIQ